MVPGQPTRPGEAGKPSEEARPGQPGETPRPSEEPGRADTSDLLGSSSGQESSLPGEQGAAGGGGNTALSYNGAADGAYIDSALPITQYRLRYDALNDMNRPDRADYFYPKCGCFRTLAAQGKPGGDPNAPGPGTVPADNVNAQILYNTIEFAPIPRLSGWVDVPVRWVDIFETNGVAPQFNSGLSDIMFGFKGAIVYNPTQLVTFQLRTYAPSGNASLGLGRNNWNLEPGLLFYQRLSSRLFFEGMIEDFIPVASADDFAGNVLTYGGSLSYLLYNRPNFRILPVYEMVGWNVLSGKELTPAGPQSAAGDFIANAKFGVRFGFGQMTRTNYFVSRADVYLGYGRALTGDVWYKNMARAEFRLRF